MSWKRDGFSVAIGMYTAAQQTSFGQ